MDTAFQIVVLYVLSLAAVAITLGVVHVAFCTWENWF